VFHRLSEEDLIYAASLRQRFDPAKVRVSGAGRLYHPAAVGGFGLLHSHLALQLAESIREDQDGVYILCWRGGDHTIRSLEL
jgi:hypothetical protein